MPLQPSMLDAARLYAAAGFGIFPLHRGSRLPAIKWGRIQERHLSDAELVRWFDEPTPHDLALALGGTSTGTFCYDYDDRALSDWVWANHEELFPDDPWIERTGSGKYHVFYRSDEPVKTQPHKLGNAIHAGEVRSRGAFVVISPSGHPSGGDYETVAGDFTRIPLLVGDPHAHYNEIVRRFEIATGIVVDYSDTAILPPLPPHQRNALEAKLRAANLSKQTLYTILLPGHGYDTENWAYTGATSKSEVDFRVIGDLIDTRFPQDEIHACFTSFTIGDYCYRSRTNGDGSIGRGYFERTYANVLANKADKADAPIVVTGENFVFLSPPVMVDGTPPHWRAALREARTGKEGEVEWTYAQLLSPKKFCFQVGERLETIAELTPSANQNYIGFVKSFLRWAETEPHSHDMEEGGSIRVEAIRIMKEDYALQPEAPDDAEGFTYGWLDDEGVHLRSSRLIQRFNTYMRAVKEDSVRRVLRRMGGKQYPHHYKGHGVEMLWLLPAALLKEN